MFSRQAYFTKDVAGDDLIPNSSKPKPIPKRPGKAVFETQRWDVFHSTAPAAPDSN